MIPAVLLLMNYPAHAATVLPGSADPGRFLEDQKTVPEPVLTSPEVSEPTQQPSQIPPGSEGVTFALNRVDVVGGTVYPAEELEALFNDKLHRTVTLAEFYEVIGRIEQRYHRDGYVMARVILPTQDVTEGIVRVQIVEGYVSSVESQGVAHPDQITQTLMARIRAMNPFRISDLEKNTLLLGDASGSPVHAVLKLNAAADGGVDVILIFDDKPIAGSASIDNSGTRYSGPVQFGFTATALNQILPNQQFTLSGLTTSPTNNLKYVSLAERIALDADGDSLSLLGNYAHTEPGFRLEREEIVGDTFNYGFSVTHPVLRSRAQNLSMTADLTAKDTVTDALGERLYDDRLRIVSASAHYDVEDGWRGADAADVKFSQGLNLPGVTKTGTLNMSREDGHSDFSRISGNVSRLTPITGSLELFVAGMGQYAWSPLLSSEQFGFGGSQFGRAFDASELTGDDGLAGVTELRVTLPTDVANLGVQLFGFTDAGRVWNYSGGKPIYASSAGFGLRYSYGSSLSGTLTLAQPIDHRVAAPEWGNGKNPRVFFTLNWIY